MVLPEGRTVLTGRKRISPHSREARCFLTSSGSAVLRLARKIDRERSVASDGDDGCDRGRGAGTRWW